MKHVFDLSPEAYDRVQAVSWQTTPQATRVRDSWRSWHWRRYGGSPIPVRIDRGEWYRHTRLFLGPSFASEDDMARPDVESIVNLSELDDWWPLMPGDRRWVRGENVFGYTWSQLASDAAEIAGFLRDGQRVLIHCTAGVNRSPTLTIAVVMTLEGLSAAGALGRVQRFHPRALPEDRHWRALRQLEIALWDRKLAR